MRSMGLAMLIAGMAVSGAGARERIELLGDSAVMTSPARTPRAPKTPFAYEAPCAFAPSETCEGRRFGWSARPDDDAVFEVLKKVPARSEDLVAACRLDDQGAPADCVVRSESGGEPSAGAAALARGLLAAFRTPALDLTGVSSRDAEVVIPFRWSALKAGLGAGPASKPLLEAKAAPVEARWRKYGSAGGYTPELANRLGVRGEAILDCAATADGKLSDCVAANAYPRGFGFDEAMMRIVKDGKVGVEPGAAKGDRVWVRLAFTR